MKKSFSIVIAAAVLVAGLGIAFQAGTTVGFTKGSEWALVQADLLAREAGVFMPVSLKDGTFRVLIRQPRGIYKKAWQHADRHERAAQELSIMPEREGTERSDL